MRGSHWRHQGSSSKRKAEAEEHEEEEEADEETDDQDQLTQEACESSPKLSAAGDSPAKNSTGELAETEETEVQVEQVVLTNATIEKLPEQTSPPNDSLSAGDLITCQVIEEPAGPAASTDADAKPNEVKTESPLNESKSEQPNELDSQRLTEQSHEPTAEEGGKAAETKAKGENETKE